MAQYRLTMDDTTQDCAGIACIIANIGSLGVPGLNLSPGIEPSDGLLDVLVIQKADLPGLISLAASVVGGSENQNSMLHWQAKSISVEAMPPQLVQVDGEMAGRSPVNVTIMEKALRVLIPRPSEQQM